MDGEKFSKLIDNNKYQLFVFVCPCSIPLNFALHPWFVLNKKGIISRWEILFRKDACATSWGHLHKNFVDPFQGLEITDFSHKHFWNAKLIDFVEGDENSFVKRMVDFIDSSELNYPYCHKYSLPTLNSNTYVQWIMSRFPEFDIKLPWNCFGKNNKVALPI